MKVLLDPGDVAPRAVLPADPAVDARGFEPECAVQARAGVVRKCHPGEGAVETVVPQAFEERLVQRAAGAGAAAAAFEGEARLARPPVGGALGEAVGVGEAGDAAVD